MIEMKSKIKLAVKILLFIILGLYLFVEFIYPFLNVNWISQDFIDVYTLVSIILILVLSSINLINFYKSYK